MPCRQTILLIPAATPTRARYSSSMCSIRPSGDLANRLGKILADLTATTAHDDDDPQIADQLATAWAIIAAADPEVASRTARYSDNSGNGHSEG